MTPEEKELRDKYTEIDGDSVYLRIGVQGFCVYTVDPDLQEDNREWYRDMLGKALATLKREFVAPTPQCPRCGAARREWLMVKGCPECNPDHDLIEDEG